MFGWKNISIELLTGHPLLTAAAFMVLVATAVFLYRKTNPPLPLYIRSILWGLRVLALIALFLALFQPVIRYTRQFERLRRVSLLLDESLSMNKIEAGQSRQKRLDSLLASPLIKQLEQQTELTKYYFGKNISTNNSEVDKTATAIGNIISELDKMKTGNPDDYWLLFTDGNSNFGQAPVERAKNITTPIIAVDLSSGAGNFDIRVVGVVSNPVVFSGRPTEIKAKLNWQDAKGKDVVVELREGSKVLNKKHLSIDQEDGTGEVVLKYVPDKPGQKLLQVHIPPLTGEESTGNNEQSFSVKVLKSRLLVLIAAEHPDYEVGFLKRYFDQSDRYDVKLIATGSKAGNLSGRLPTKQTEMNRYDLIILYDPDPAKLEGRKDILKSYLQDKGGALWVLMGKQFALRGPQQWFDDLLPFSQSKRQPIRYLDYHGEPEETQLFHPAVRLADNLSSIRETWAELPPFQSLVSCDVIHPEGVVLVTASVRTANEPPPVLGYRRIGPGKVLAQAGLPFWTWGFITLGLGEDNSVYNRFIDGVASWLTVTDDLEPTRIIPAKRVFTRGEPITFDGYAYDPGFRPIPGVHGTVTLQGDNQREPLEKDLMSITEGEYRVRFDNLAPGTYRYNARFEKDGRILKENSGKIKVETFSLEEFDQSGKPAQLLALAKVSGGKYFTYRDFNTIQKFLDTSPIIEQKKYEFTFWNKLWLLLVIVGSLAVEWLIRKLNQLI